MSKPFLGARGRRAMPYVVNSRGERILAGDEVTASAILAVHRHAEAHEQHGREHDAWKVRRAA